MRWVPVHEDIKVPVFKNLAYAVKLLFKADKSMLIWGVVAEVSSQLFTRFFQSVLFLKVLLSVIDGSGSFNYYAKCIAVFAAVALVNEVVSVYSDYAMHIGSKKVFKAVNNMIFEKAADVDISCYEDPDFYDRFQRATSVVTGGYFDLLTYDFSGTLGSFIAFSSVVGVVMTIDSAYLLFLLPVMLVFVVEIFKSKVVYKRDFAMTKNNRTKDYAKRTIFLKDFSKDIRTSDIFSVIMKRFDFAVKSNIEIIKTYGWRLFLYSMASSLFGEFIPIVGTYAYAGYQFVETKSLPVSGFSVVLSAINSVRTTTTYIAENIAELSQMALYFQNLRDFFEYNSKVVSGDKEVGEFGSIEFKNVSFKYPSAEKNSIENVNLKITKGQTVAVVGVNGAGKTTFVKLLLRFYDVSEGEILYNGVNIKEYKLDELRMKFATVFQDYRNFALSVNENVMCRECSEQDKAKAEKALKQSGAFLKIQNLPQGADTVLTREFDENGIGLSGGEAQKTAVARMFARDFDIAILDEPSSALDPIAEYQMYENLISATKNKTVIYISHRLSSAVLSDEIFVLSSGTVLESGTHTQLMAAGGEYSKMFNLQASSYNKEKGEREHD